MIGENLGTAALVVFAQKHSNHLQAGLKWIDKPDSVVVPNRNHSDHSSCPSIARGIERPYPRAMGGPPNPPIWPCSRWGLPCVHHHWRTGELLPRHFNLTVRLRRMAVCFLWYFPPITRGRR
jgi:hypothetical protein